MPKYSLYGADPMFSTPAGNAAARAMFGRTLNRAAGAALPGVAAGYSSGVKGLGDLPSSVSISDIVKAQREALIVDGSGNPVTGRYVDEIRASVAMRLPLPYEANNAITGRYSKYSMPDARASLYSYPSNQMRIGSALAGAATASDIRAAQLSQQARLDRISAKAAVAANAGRQEGAAIARAMRLNGLGAAPDTAGLQSRADKAQKDLDKAVKEGRKKGSATAKKGASAKSSSEAKQYLDKGLTELGNIAEQAVTAAATEIGKSLGTWLTQKLDQLGQEIAAAAYGFDLKTVAESTAYARLAAGQVWAVIGDLTPAALAIYVGPQAKGEAGLLDPDGDPVSSKDFAANKSVVDYRVQKNDPARNGTITGASQKALEDRAAYDLIIQFFSDAVSAKNAFAVEPSVYQSEAYLAMPEAMRQRIDAAATTARRYIERGEVMPPPVGGETSSGAGGLSTLTVVGIVAAVGLGVYAFTAARRARAA